MRIKQNVTWKSKTLQSWQRVNFFRHFHRAEIVYKTTGKGETEMNEHHNNLRLVKSSALVLQ